MSEALASELERLAELLATNVPGHARAREQLALGPPFGAVAALWAAVGWSAALEPAGIERPDPGASHRRAQALLDSYRHADASFSVSVDALPVRFVIVEVSEQGAGFSFVATGPADPPLQMVSTSQGAIVVLAASSVGWIANMLVKRGFAPWYRTFVNPRPAAVLVEAGSSPFPTISPATRRLSPSAWVLPAQLDARAVSEHGAVVAHVDLPALTDWLCGLDGLTQLGLGVLPGARLELRVDPAVIASDDELRDYRDPDKPELRTHVGTIAGRGVLISSGPWGVTLATDPSPTARAAVEQELRKRQWLVGPASWRL